MRHKISVCVLAGAVSGAAIAAPTTQPKTPTKPPPHVVQGTKQLSGENAVLGQEYTLNKEWPMNFKLDAAEYSTARLRLGQFDNIPKADEKFLIISFTLHNPQSRENLGRGNTFQFTAVDDTDTNREGFGYWAIKGTKQDFNVRLKPGQKMSGYTYIVVPATATVPKLIVKAQDNTVLRYDLRGKIKPLSGPVVDPANPAKTAALAVVPAALGTVVQSGNCDLNIESVAYSDMPLPGPKLTKDQRYIVMMATVGNGLQRTIPLRADSFRIKAIDEDGIETGLRLWLARASTDVDGGGPVEAGKQVRVRIYAAVPSTIAFKELTVTSGSDLRTYRYDISGVQ